MKASEVFQRTLANKKRTTDIRVNHSNLTFMKEWQDKAVWLIVRVGDSANM